MPQTPPPAVSPQSPLGTAVGAKVRAAVEAEHSPNMLAAYRSAWTAWSA